jgi:hypothetical protein
MRELLEKIATRIQLYHENNTPNPALPGRIRELAT